MIDPFADIYQTCNTGDPKDKFIHLPDFPRMIDLELTNSCNFRCLMCPTGNLSMSRASGFMSRHTYRKILDQCAEHGTALRFIGWGEGTLHKMLPDFIRKASDAGILTHLNTNGSKMTPDYMVALIKSELTSIKFSFQGVGRESFKEMRNTDFFRELMETIEFLNNLREEGGYPFISISTTVTDESAEMIASFMVEAEKICDKLSIGTTTFDFMDLDAVRLKPEQIERIKELAANSSLDKRHPVPCPEVYDKLSISWDGTARVCCNDHSGHTNLGNVNETPISKIWHHPEMEEYRSRLAFKEYKGPLCSVCYDYLGVTDAPD